MPKKKPSLGKRSPLPQKATAVKEPNSFWILIKELLKDPDIRKSAQAGLKKGLGWLKALFQRKPVVSPVETLTLDTTASPVVLKALSVKQPWAWAILHAGKDIENRPKPTKYRGTIALHASREPRKDWPEYYPKRAAKVPPPDEWIFGAIIGLVDIVDCVQEHRSKWFSGEFGYVLTNPRPLKTPISCPGSLGLWNIPPATQRRLSQLV